MTQSHSPFDAAAASAAYRNALQVIARGRARRRRRHPRRARRPARVAQAHRQRELRLAGRAAHDGQLALRQVRRGHHRAPLLRRLPERRHRRAGSPPTTRRRCSARRTPTSSRTRASTPTSSRSGRSSPSASSRRRSSRPAPSTSTTCPRPTGRRCAASSATSACSACRSTPAATSRTASGRTSAARCSSSRPTAPTRRPGCSTTTVVRATAREFKPLVADRRVLARTRARSTSRKMREIADEVGATLMVDMAHFAGLVAGKVFTGDFDPVPHAHVTTTTTHKSLRGPRGGMVLCQPEYADAVDRGCPMVLGGPLGARHGGQGRRARRGPAAGVRRPTRSEVVDNAVALADGLTAARRPPGHRRHREPPRAPRRVAVRAHRPAGRVGPARRRHRHQPQRDPARPERRLVHLRRPASARRR